MWQCLVLTHCFSSFKMLSKLLFSCVWKRVVERSQLIAVAQKSAVLKALSAEC